MKHEIIKTENYLLIVDESEIKVGNWVCNIQRPYIKECQDIDAVYFNRRNDVFKNVIAHLPLNGSPILEDVNLLPKLEEDNLEQLAEDWIDQNSDKWSNNNDEVGDNYGSFISGYNKAKEKYKYTEEDMRKAVNAGLSVGYGLQFNIDKQQEEADKIIQYLSQPKSPAWFEVEMVDFEVDMGLGEECIEYGQYPKTTTTPEGYKQWVGRYIY